MMYSYGDHCAYHDTTLQEFQLLWYSVFTSILGDNIIHSAGSWPAHAIYGVFLVCNDHIILQDITMAYI